MATRKHPTKAERQHAAARARQRRRAHTNPTQVDTNTIGAMLCRTTLRQALARRDAKQRQDAT